MAMAMRDESEEKSRDYRLDIIHDYHMAFTDVKVRMSGVNPRTGRERRRKEDKKNKQTNKRDSRTSCLIFSSSFG